MNRLPAHPTWLDFAALSDDEASLDNEAFPNDPALQEHTAIPSRPASSGNSAHPARSTTPDYSVPAGSSWRDAGNSATPADPAASAVPAASALPATPAHSITLIPPWRRRAGISNHSHLSRPVNFPLHVTDRRTGFPVFSNSSKPLAHVPATPPAPDPNPTTINVTTINVTTINVTTFYASLLPELNPIFHENLILDLCTSAPRCFRFTKPNSKLRPCLCGCCQKTYLHVGRMLVLGYAFGQEVLRPIIKRFDAEYRTWESEAKNAWLNAKAIEKEGESGEGGGEEGEKEKELKREYDRIRLASNVLAVMEAELRRQRVCLL